MSNHPENEVHFLNDIPIEYTEHELNQNQEESDQHQMILTIDFGNKIEQLKIYDITNPHKDIYEFCLLHKLNYYNMEEVTKQTMEVIAQQEIRLLQPQNEMDNSTHEDEKSHHNVQTFSTNNIETIEQEQIPQNAIEIEQELSNISSTNNNANSEQQFIKDNINVESINNECDNNKSNKCNYEHNKIKHKLFNSNNKQVHKSGISNGLFAYEICNNHNCKDNKNDIHNNYNSNNNNNVNTSSIKTTKRSAQSKPSYRKNLQLFKTKKQNINNNINTNNNIPHKEKHINTITSENTPSLSINALLQNDIIKKENNKYIIYKTIPNNNNNTTIQHDISKQNLRTNSNTNVYERNIKFKENAKKHIESLRNILNQSDDELFTFKPKINPISDKVLSKRQKAQNECNNPERIRNYKKYFEQKREQHKINLNYGISSDDLVNCTFKPEINPKSELIDNNKRNSYNVNHKKENNNNNNNNNTFEMKREQIPSQPNGNSSNNNNNTNRFEKLYLDTYVKQQHLQQKQMEIKEQFTYNPVIINDNSNITTPFNKRLEQYHCKSKEKIIKIKNYIKEEEKSCHTFQPNLYHNKNYRSRKTITSNNTEHTNNNSTLNNHNNKSNDVFSTLYLYNQIYSQKKTNTYQQINKIEKQQANTNNTCKSSNELMYNNKMKAFKKIFSLLDSDGDGIISSININIKKLPCNINNIIKPIIDWIYNEQEMINEDDFVSIMEQFYTYLSFEHKREVIAVNKQNELGYNNNNVKKINNNNNSFTFKPQLISSKSLRMKTRKDQQEIRSVGQTFNNDVRDLSRIRREKLFNNKTYSNVNLK